MKIIDYILKIVCIITLLFLSISVLYNFIFIPLEERANFDKCFSYSFSQYSKAQTDSGKSIENDAVKKLSDFCSIRGSSVVLNWMK